NLSVAVPGAGVTAGGCGINGGSMLGGTRLSATSRVNSTEVIVTVTGGPIGVAPGVSVNVNTTSSSAALAVAPSANSCTPAVSCAPEKTLSVPLKVISLPPVAASKKRIAAPVRVRVPGRKNGPSVVT